MDASEIYSKKTQCKRGDISQRKWKFHFPAADGRITLPGRDQELSTSTLIREHPIRGEGHASCLCTSSCCCLSSACHFVSSVFCSPCTSCCAADLPSLHIPPSQHPPTHTSATHFHAQHNTTPVVSVLPSRAASKRNSRVSSFSIRCRFTHFRPQCIEIRHFLLFQFIGLRFAWKKMKNGKTEKGK